MPGIRCRCVHCRQDGVCVRALVSVHEERDLLSVPLAFRSLHGDHAQVLAIINLHAIDVFVNPALRLQALDQGLLATLFSSITSSVIVDK